VSKQLFALVVFFLFVPLLCACGSGVDTNSKSIKTDIDSSCFKVSGRLNYKYDPGVILPLRSGKILALGGTCYDEQPERVVTATDGKRYGNSDGMIELFDPQSSQTKVLTQMPFTFFDQVEGAANRRQMKAIELKDGRILLVGRFCINSRIRNSPFWKSAAQKTTPRKFDDNFHYLPFWSKTQPKLHLKSIAPECRNTMFGLIFNPADNSFEVIDAPDTLPPRWFVGLNLLASGQVLITGGSITMDNNWHAFPNAQVLEFDPATKNLKILGQLRHSRYGHDSIEISPSRFLIINGVGASEAEAKEQYCAFYNPDGSCATYAHRSCTHNVELWDVPTSQPKLIGQTLTGRYDFDSLLLPDRNIFIHGGCAGSLLGYSASELYDSKGGTTTFIGENYQQRKTGFATHEVSVPYRLLGEGIDFRASFIKGHIFLAGRDQAYFYDWRKLNDRDWLRRHDSPQKLLMPRIHHHLISTPNGKVFVVGGLTYNKISGSSISNARSASLIEEVVNVPQDAP
jgi:hypothetical protein